MPSDTYEADAQDQAEVYDEDNYSDGSGDDGGEMRTFEELPDVYDATTAVGDDDDDAALIGEELDDDEIIDLERDGDETDLEDDDLVARDQEVFDPEDEEPDEFDALDDLGEATANLARADEADIEFTGDIDGATDPDDEHVEDYETDRVSDEDLRMLGYPDEKKDKDGKPDKSGTGATAEDVAEECDPRQEDLLDEGVEETFPASDPVSVKRIT